MKLNLLYFAWVRERIGIDGETRELNGAATVADALDALRSLGPNYVHAFEAPERLRFALDQDFVGEGAALRDGAELAIFPPVTGGCTGGFDRLSPGAPRVAPGLSLSKG